MYMYMWCVHMLSVTAATATPLVLPWEYNWTSFPAVWFGGNGTDWESPEQIAAIGKYQMAILGWQDLLYEADWTAVVYTQLTQAAIIKDAHPHIKVMVYAGFGFAFGLNAAVWSLMQDAAYSDFFLQQQHGAEFTHTNCEQMHQNNPHCVGWFWNFANASARDYFVSHLVAPLAEAPSIDGVFFDAVNYGYDIPEVIEYSPGKYSPRRHSPRRCSPSPDVLHPRSASILTTNTYGPGFYSHSIAAV